MLLRRLASVPAPATALALAPALASESCLVRSLTEDGSE